MEKKKYTKKETERLEKLKKTTEEMETEGYTRNDVLLSSAVANIGGVLSALPLVAVMFLLHHFFAVPKGKPSYDIFLIALVVLIVVHEAIHGICFASFAKDGAKAVSFGFNLRAFAPYATCDNALTKSKYIISALMPCLILGIIPAIISLFAPSTYLFALGELMILGAGGDILCSIKILTYNSNSKEICVIDHPAEIGFIVFEKTGC